MNGTFNVLGSAYGVDPVSYNQRRHQERLAQEALDARVTGFISGASSRGSLSTASTRC